MAKSHISIQELKINASHWDLSSGCWPGLAASESRGLEGCDEKQEANGGLRLRQGDKGLLLGSPWAHPL